MNLVWHSTKACRRSPPKHPELTGTGKGPQKSQDGKFLSNEFQVMRILGQLNRVDIFQMVRDKLPRDAASEKR